MIQRTIATLSLGLCLELDWKSPVLLCRISAWLTMLSYTKFTIWRSKQSAYSRWISWVCSPGCPAYSFPVELRFSNKDSISAPHSIEVWSGYGCILPFLKCTANHQCLSSMVTPYLSIWHPFHRRLSKTCAFLHLSKSMIYGRVGFQSTSKLVWKGKFPEVIRLAMELW